MSSIITAGQIVSAIAVIVLVLLQERSSGVGGAFGGGSGGEFYQRRRGVEKMLFIGTIVLGVVFVIFSILNLIS